MAKQFSTDVTGVEVPNPSFSEDRHVFQHLPLTRSNDIRLMQLLPGDPDQPLRCKIIHVSLDQNPSYEAVSYVWGQGAPTSDSPSLAVEHGLGQLKVTENCYRVLRPLRGYLRRRTLWLDAVCIDQSPTAVNERNHQVNLMRHIYTQAAGVLIYPRGPDDNQRMSSVEDEINRYLRTHLAVSPMLVEILRMAWFRRTWVLQEAVLARKPLLVLESGNVCFEKFIIASRLAVGRADRATDFTWPAVLDIMNLVRGVPDTDLLQLLNQSRGLETTDSRDKIFALLAIATDGSHDGYVVDYSRSTGETYVAFALALIAKWGNLNLLKSCDGSPLLDHCDDPNFWETSHALPTWVPDWRRNIYKGLLSIEKRGTVWTSKAGERRKPLDQPGQTSQDLKLRVQARVFVRVTKAGTIGRGTKMTTEEWNGWGNFAFPIWGDAPCHMIHPEEEYPFSRIGFRFDPGNPIDLTDWKEIVALKENVYCRRVIATNNGYYGLAPYQTAENDVICCLVGSTVPFVLRKVPDFIATDENQYMLVGECYIYGTMKMRDYSVSSFSDFELI